MSDTNNLSMKPDQESGFAIKMQEALEAARTWRGKNFLTLKEHTTEEINALLSLAAVLKEKKKKHPMEAPLLPGKNIVLLFEKTSTRTRCAFEVAVRDEGGHATFLGMKPDFCSKIKEKATKPFQIKRLVALLIYQTCCRIRPFLCHPIIFLSHPTEDTSGLNQCPWLP